MKTELLDVPAEVIAKEGLVSDEVARIMAVGARRKLRSTYALAVTCAAGPEPHDGAAVGTMSLGLAGPGFAEARSVRVPGDRAQVRAFAATFALSMLRNHLLEQHG